MDSNSSGRSDRKIKLSQIRYYQKTYTDAQMSVRSSSYMGRISAAGGELIGDTSEAHGTTRKPAFLELFDSTTVPGDLIGLPSMEKSDDHVPIEWKAKGREAFADVGKLLAWKKINVPEGTRLILELYPDQDPDYGQVVGIKIKGARFEPLQKGTPRKKQEDSQPADAAAAKKSVKVGAEPTAQPTAQPAAQTTSQPVAQPVAQPTSPKPAQASGTGAVEPPIGA